MQNLTNWLSLFFEPCRICQKYIEEPILPAYRPNQVIKYIKQQKKPFLSNQIDQQKE